MRLYFPLSIVGQFAVLLVLSLIVSFVISILFLSPLELQDQLMVNAEFAINDAITS
jgi:hypothetical protein